MSTIVNPTTDKAQAPTSEDTRSSLERADDLAAPTITIHDWSPQQYRDPNVSGIWHVILREERGHPIPELRARLDAMPADSWGHMSEARRSAHITRGYSWHGSEEDNEADPEFTFIYVDRYELIDTMISTKTGKWTCVFRLLGQAGEVII